MAEEEEQKNPRSHGPAPRFSRLEVRQMETLLREGRDEVLDEKFHQKLADEFNRVPGRAGPRAIQTKQVQRWFCSRYARSAPDAVKDVVSVSDDSLSNIAVETNSDMSKEAGEKIPELEKYDFEARSSRDKAWYDVGTFLSYRLNSGEPSNAFREAKTMLHNSWVVMPYMAGGSCLHIMKLGYPTGFEEEVHVRFEDFGSDDDEWVDVKKAVRLRSVPLESSECQRVAVGDLVLCFRDSHAQACYFDAHVIDIQRRVHDIRGCRCLFSVRYDHDNIEERISSRRLCRRP